MKGNFQVQWCGRKATDTVVYLNDVNITKKLLNKVIITKKLINKVEKLNE